ncbi:MAG: type I-B CRISPR-associated protein Cas7/Csh2 [Candidatus Heimdallarchaeota archaeon]|nr:type I-B CRISPR-associated protein Cas7/Csh2 [Candidatus Heimdallarchaeota archaeon]
MSEIIQKRSELVFLYDIRDGNPNGDPMDVNKPRMDEETGINLVTDVRLKRTIRDYLHDSLGEEILIRTILMEDGSSIQDAKARALDFLEVEEEESPETKIENIGENILKKCIDTRLFGATLPIEVKDGKKTKSSSFVRTGPVQFNMGRSLHQVEIKHIKGTGAFAATAGKGQKTFRDEYILPYSLISFYGLINENTSKFTNLSEEDIRLLLQGIWKGTKGLITRSKMGQMPRLLLRVEYAEKDFHIGDLDKVIQLESEKEDVALRGPEDYTLELSSLVKKLQSATNKIHKIYHKVDEAIQFTLDGKEVTLAEALQNAVEDDQKLAEITFE